MPSAVPPHARLCLEAVAAAGLGRSIAIGGAFGLAHYLEYRSTHDVDAWWTDAATPDIRRRVVGVIEDVLRRSGPVRSRTWGEVTSIELAQEDRTVFGVQIADRSAQLKPLEESPWPGGIRLDSLDDLVASKMTALVERGAPRDFRDIHALCGAGLIDPTRCWRLWEDRCTAAAEPADLQRARLAIRSHLARIETSRPLESIAVDGQREQAARLRRWFKREFLGGD